MHLPFKNGKTEKKTWFRSTKKISWPKKPFPAWCFAFEVKWNKMKLGRGWKDIRRVLFVCVIRKATTHDLPTAIYVVFFCFFFQFFVFNHPLYIIHSLSLIFSCLLFRIISNAHWLLMNKIFLRSAANKVGKLRTARPWQPEKINSRNVFTTLAAQKSMLPQHGTCRNAWVAECKSAIQDVSWLWWCGKEC